LGERPEVIERAYWVDNPMLIKLFDGALEATAAQHQLNPSKFHKQDWKDEKNSQRQKEFLKKLEQHIENGNQTLKWENKHKVDFFRLVSSRANLSLLGLIPQLGPTSSDDSRDYREWGSPHRQKRFWDCGIC